MTSLHRVRWKGWYHINLKTLLSHTFFWPIQRTHAVPILVPEAARPTHVIPDSVKSLRPYRIRPVRLSPTSFVTVQRDVLGHSVKYVSTCWIYTIAIHVMVNTNVQLIIFQFAFIAKKTITFYCFWRQISSYTFWSLFSSFPTGLKILKKWILHHTFSLYISIMQLSQLLYMYFIFNAINHACLLHTIIYISWNLRGT